MRRMPVMKMKSILMSVALGLAAAADGAVFYVDAEHGDDGYDGLQPAVDAARMKGPKKTLAAVSGLTEDYRGDIVYAAPGTYDTGNMGAYRVIVRSGCKFIATGPAGETVIMGRNDPDVAADVSPYGCGANALTCVRLQDKAQIVGFTLCGGRGPGAAAGQSGGGVYGHYGNGLLIDCIVTNCIAGGTAGITGVDAVRCRFTGNFSCGKNYEPNDMRGGTAWNCIFESSDARRSSYLNYSVMSVKLRNCRVVNELKDCFVYNSHTPGGNSNTKYYHSYYYSLGTGSEAVEASSSMSSGNLQIDADKRPVKGSNVGIDKGSYDYYTATADERILPYLDKDFAGGPRVYGGAIDIGPGEYDQRFDFATALFGDAVAGFTVEKATAGIAVDGASVSMADGDEMIWVRQVPNLGTTVKIGCSFTVQVSGEGVLSLFRDGATTAFKTVSAADGTVTVDLFHRGPVTLRLNMSGSGLAAVSGVSITKILYVDAENGDDASDGMKAEKDAGSGPYLSLEKAMKRVDEVRTDRGNFVVVAAPGVYTNGNYGVHRVRVRSNTVLVASEGREKTVIEGRAAPGAALDSSPYGCGSGALDGVYLNENAELHGFTVRNCHGNVFSGNVSYNGAVIGVNRLTSLVYDCTITNNFGASGVGVCEVTAIRCLIADNTAGNKAANACNAKLYNCFCARDRTPTSVYVYGYTDVIFNGCTIDYYSSDSGPCNCTYINSYVLVDRYGGTLMYSAYSYLGGNNTLDDDSVFSVLPEEMSVDSAYTPVKGANSGIDRGSWEHYVDGASPRVLELLDKDYAGNPRLSNGQIDIGCGEYDWRVSYASALGSRVTVSEVSPSAVETASGGVRLTDGEFLSVRMKNAQRGTYRFNIRSAVSGTGTLTVRVNGVEVAVQRSGSEVFTVELADPASDTVTFVHAGEGSSEILSAGFRYGLLMKMQ